MKNSNIESNLTLQKSIDIARLHEQLTAQARQRSREDTFVHLILHSKFQSKQSKFGLSTKPNKADSTSKLKWIHTQ